MQKVKVVVVFSGGQDSTTCLGLAIKQYGADNVLALSFNYGQKHAIELDCAQTITSQLGIPLQVVDMPFFTNFVTSALLGEGSVNEPHKYKEGLPASFVPNRNALFLTLAHAYAQEVGAAILITGVCETDYSGYPDCRGEFIQTLEKALNIGYETNISIRTPLMHLDKAETFALAETYGILDTVLNESHTCYNGDHHTKHVWGYGCGECPACKLRESGYATYLVQKENR